MRAFARVFLSESCRLSTLKTTHFSLSRHICRANTQRMWRSTASPAPNSRVCSSNLMRVIHEQRGLSDELLASEQTQAPYAALLLGTFGSALHESVTPYFYLKTGASLSEIGRINSIILSSGVIAVPHHPTKLSPFPSYPTTSRPPARPSLPPARPPARPPTDHHPIT